jgi:hypothetical protein
MHLPAEAHLRFLGQANCGKRCDKSITPNGQSAIGSKGRLSLPSTSLVCTQGFQAFFG